MRVFAVALPIALIFGVVTAEAQFNPIGQSDIIVTHADREHMNEAALPLYDTDSPKVGATANWTDSGSGSSGTVELVGVYEWRGMSCRRLHHIVKLVGIRDNVTMTVDRCKTDSGEWKIRY
jgi:hypothetical protein